MKKTAKKAFNKTKSKIKASFHSFKEIIKKVKTRINSHGSKKTKPAAKKSRQVETAKTSESFIYQEVLPQPHHGVSNHFELPWNYDDNKIVLLVRDPWWLYSYWEVNEHRQRQVWENIAREGCQPDKTVLRVYDVTDVPLSHHHSFFDIEVGCAVGNWYIDVGQPNRQWMAELGIRTQDGRFFAWVRSNVVRTPRFGISDILDEEWMLPDELFWKIFGLSGGFSDRKSSLEVREFLERYLRGIISSERISSDRVSSHSLIARRKAQEAVSRKS